MKLTPIRNSIIFKFLDEIDSRGQFVTTTESGIILTSHHEDSARNPRWVEVTAVGPDCEKVIPGDRVLLPALRWTKGVVFEKQRLWRSDESEVVALLKRRGGLFTFLDKYVGFIREDSRINQLTSGLTVIGQTPETPSGIVIRVGEKVDPILEVGSKIYFDDTNFYNKFELFDVKFWFIKQDDILAYETPTEEPTE